MSSFKETINSGKPVLVDFYADWCGPCQSMNPVLKDLAGELGDDVKIIKVDVDKNPGAARAFQVRGVPTFLIFKDGKPVWRASGVQPRAELVKALRSAGA
ncbi:MAG TPA: thioredoxin [Cryomorphaceae bacterium]|nr:thioredoxin [Cryomorphaceae bacterium]